MHEQLKIMQHENTKHTILSTRKPNNFGSTIIPPPKYKSIHGFNNFFSASHRMMVKP